MIELKITKEIIAEAKKLYDFGILNNSYTQGEGNKCGALGEVLVRDSITTQFKKIHLTTI